VIWLMNQIPGVVVMPWQEQVLMVAFELDALGFPVYRYIIVTVPRQQGKTTLLLGVELFRCLLWPSDHPQRVVYSAQNGWAGHKKLLEDQVPLIKRSPALASEVSRFRYAAGDDGVDFKNGSMIRLQASGASAGHGPTNDLCLIDEARFDTDNTREQAMVPSMMTRPDGQLWIVSTAGNEAATYLKQKRDTGRALVTDPPERTDTCYFEWSADDEAPIDREETWISCMPALGHTVRINEIRSAYQKAVDEQETALFEQEFLNRWTVGNEQVIPEALWRAVCGDYRPDEETTLFLGIDVALDRRTGAIVVVDGALTAELIEHVTDVPRMVARVAELAKEHSAMVAVNKAGPSGAMIAELEALGVEVAAYGPSDVADATTRLYDGVADQRIRVRSSRGDPLSLAVAGAGKRIIGERWYWGRTSGTVDISPLVALTLAYDMASANARTPEPFAIWA
jgi:hypothetical protein